MQKSRYKKQNVQRNGNGLHLKSAPAIATQLKGYSLDALKITAQRAQPSISAKIPSEISISTYKGTVHGSSKAASLQEDLKSFDANHGKSRQEPEGASNERIEEPQGKATSWDSRSQHSAEQPLCETSGKQKQLLFHENQTERGNQAWSERASKHSTSGVSRYARGSQEISSDTHGMKPNTRRISGGRKEQLQRGRPKRPSAVVDGENGKRVGRLRLLSKAAGERESTPGMCLAHAKPNHALSFHSALYRPGTSLLLWPLLPDIWQQGIIADRNRVEALPDMLQIRMISEPLRATLSLGMCWQPLQQLWKGIRECRMSWQSAIRCVLQRTVTLIRMNIWQAGL